MPSNLVKTPEDEMKWNKAKEIVGKASGMPESHWGNHHWAMATSIFEKIKKPSMTVATRGPQAARDAPI